MPSVQFNTAKDVVTAYENTGCPSWSLWDGTKLRFKGSGAPELETWLDLMKQGGGGSCIYALAYYEEVTEKKKINSKTPYDGSFNFRLLEEGEDLPQTFEQNRRGIASRITGLESKLDLLLTRETEPAENELDKKLGIVGEILQHPQLGPVVTSIIQQLTAKFISPVTAPRPEAPVYELARPAAVSGIGNAVEQDPRLEKALERLIRLDPRLADHLQKLALIGERDPATFQYILNTLDNMPVNAN